MDNSENISTISSLLWFIGWLFTIAYADLAVWRMIVGVLIWPFFLGDAIR